jgi:hypothetical protein
VSLAGGPLPVGLGCPPGLVPLPSIGYGGRVIFDERVRADAADIRDAVDIDAAGDIEDAGEPEDAADIKDEVRFQFGPGVSRFIVN